MTETLAYRMSFRCISCNATWTWDYEVRQQRFSGGTELSSYFRDGVAVSSPLGGQRCPECGGVRGACIGAVSVGTPIRTGP
jgi:hypothetical protein